MILAIISKHKGNVLILLSKRYIILYQPFNTKVCQLKGGGDVS